MKKSPKGRVLDSDKLPNAAALMHCDVGSTITIEVTELLRISYLVGAFNALHILHGQPLADEWVQLPNTNRVFVGSRYWYGPAADVKDSRCVFLPPINGIHREQG
jgi:hypothetical protein